jgi:hypothetical protein
MPNPWLAIPLADYEGHMAAPEVFQTQALCSLFAEALAVRRPASVAVLGLAGGNGLEHIDRSLTRRIVGLDINPAYLDAVRERYPDQPGLELHATDLAEEAIQLPPVELVHAALVFEHAGTGRCLDNALALLGEDGALSVVLQLPGASEQAVGASGIASIRSLESHFSFIAPKAFRTQLLEHGLEPVYEAQRAVPGGKALWMGIFVRG